MMSRACHFSPTETIDLSRGACAVKGNVPVAGHVKRVYHEDAFDTLNVVRKRRRVIIPYSNLTWGIRTNTGKPEGIFLNLQCNCHRVAYIFIKLISHRTNVSTWLSDLTSL